MQRPLYERAELFSIGRIIGAMLIFSGGLALLIGAYFVDLLPSPDGFINNSANVIYLEQIGSFQEPVFYVALEYDIPRESGGFRTIRSGHGISFEQYSELSVGDVINILYDPQRTSQWRVQAGNDELSQYGLGFLMLIFGALSLSFPALLNWASRRDDFELKDEFDKELAGVNTN